MARNDGSPEVAKYALVLIFVLIGFFIGLLLGGSGGYFLAPKPESAVVEKGVTKVQCASGSLVDDVKKCPAIAGPAECVNQTKYVYRNETVFLPCNCLRDCGVLVPVSTTTTLPPKPKTYCTSDRDCGFSNLSDIRCGTAPEVYKLLISPRCLMTAEKPYCIEEQSKQVITDSCGEGKYCKPGIGCMVNE